MKYAHVVKILGWLSITALAGCSLLPHRATPQDITAAYTQERITPILAAADDFYQAGNLSAAEDKYLAALELDAKQPRALYRLGNIAFKKSQFEKARDYFSRTIDADPSNSKAHYNLAVTCITLAQEHFRAYVAGEPNNVHRPQIETLMHRIDEFAQEKPSDATVPVVAAPVDNTSPAATLPSMVSAPAMQSPATTSAQPATTMPMKKYYKKPKKKTFRKIAPLSSQPVMPVSPSLPKQEKPVVKSQAPVAAQPEKMAAPAADDPLDALANQLKK